MFGAFSFGQAEFAQPFGVLGSSSAVVVVYGTGYVNDRLVSSASAADELVSSATASDRFPSTVTASDR